MIIFEQSPPTNELREFAPLWNSCFDECHSREHAGDCIIEQPYDCDAVVDFAGTWETYLASKPKKVRHEMKRSLRRVFEDGRAVFIRHRPRPASRVNADPRWDLFDKCRRVASKSRQAFSVAQANDATCPMNDCIRYAHEVASRRGVVDMNLLLVDGNPVAYSYNYCHRGQLHGLYHGYDFAAASHGFGKALLLCSIEDSFLRGDRYLNLGRFDSRLKVELHNRVEKSPSAIRSTAATSPRLSMLLTA